jgi:hypothetical protein
MILKIRSQYSLLMISLGLIFGNVKVSACECIEPRNIYERKRTSEAVFEGKAESQKVDSAKGIRITKFKTQKVYWKGKILEVSEMNIRSSIWGASCGTSFPMGKSALVFVHMLEDKQETILETSGCSQNIIEPNKLEIDSAYDGKEGSAKSTVEPKWKSVLLKKIEEEMKKSR